MNHHKILLFRAIFVCINSDESYENNVCFRIWNKEDFLYDYFSITEYSSLQNIYIKKIWPIFVRLLKCKKSSYSKVIPMIEFPI